jgi:heme/copper-type cytochrome/quinol oxidase subunit 3
MRCGPVTYALPPAPAPPPRRQVFVGTALAGVATLMLIGGMLAVWVLQRERALDAEGFWVPEDVTIPEVPTNVMLIGLLALVVFAQWAVYAARRGEKVHTGLALGLVGLLGLAVINAQAYVWNRIEMPIADGGYPGMFYAVTGTMTVLLIVGVMYTAVTAFRYLGGRVSDREVVAAHALYWYVLATAFSAVWFVVYVTK